MNGALWAAILVVVLATQCQPIQCQCQTSLSDVMAKLVEIQATVTGKIDNIQTQINCMAHTQQCDATTSTTTPSTTTTAADTTTTDINRENNTLVQQNIDGSDFFVKNWTDFKAGFGNESGNYWIGNDRLHNLTKTGQYKLRVDLLYRVANSTWYYAEYSQFIVGDETSNYKMSFSGFNGTADNWLDNNIQFSTKDVDNDGDAHINCTIGQGADAGFWYPIGCGYVFINSPVSSTVGFTWYNAALSDLFKLQTSRMSLIPMQQ